MNLGLATATSLAHITHVAHLDDDDSFNPNHLQLFAQAYLLNRSVGFVFSKALGYTRGSKHMYPNGFPDYSVAPDVSYVYMPPTPCNMVHSSASWSVQHLGHIRYRNDSQQFNTTRSLLYACTYILSPLSVMAGDADLFERIAGLVNSHHFTSVFVPTVTLFYNHGLHKEQLLRSLKRLYIVPYADHLVYPPVSLSSAGVVSDFKTKYGLVSPSLASSGVSGASDVFAFTTRVSDVSSSYGRGEYTATASSQFPHSDYLPEAFDEHGGTQWSSRG